MSLGWWFIIFHTTSLATVRICWNISWWVNPTTVTLKKQLTLPEFHIGRISIQISKKGLYYVSSSTITIPLAAFDFWECFLLTVKSSNLQPLSNVFGFGSSSFWWQRTALPLPSKSLPISTMDRWCHTHMLHAFDQMQKKSWTPELELGEQDVALFDQSWSWERANSRGVQS